MRGDDMHRIMLRTSRKCQSFVCTADVRRHKCCGVSVVEIQHTEQDYVSRLRETVRERDFT